MKPLYETTIINTGGRDGSVYSPDNIFNLDVAKPVALGGVVSGASNPEQCNIGLSEYEELMVRLNELQRKLKERTQL